MSLIQDADKIINKTKIKFNDRWISYILTAQSKFEMNITTFNMIDEMTDLISHYTQLQERLREYIDNNQNYNVSGKSKKLNLPDYFAYGICMISNINDCKSFKDVFNKRDDFEITDISTSENYYDEKDDDVMATYTNCMCSHSICAENSFVLTNLKTCRSIMVGCDCVNKTDIFNIEELKKLMKEKNRKKREKVKRIKLTKQKKQEEEARLLDIIEKNKRYTLWKEEDDSRNKENDEMGKEDVYSQHIRKTELDKNKKRDLLIKWKGLVMKSVKHNNKIFWENVSNLILINK